MAECGICLGSLFEHEQPIASSSTSSPPLLIERKVVSIACGHVYHDDCIRDWFREKGRQSNWKCINSCSQKPTPASIRPLFFGGNPWEQAEKEQLGSSNRLLKGKAKALEGKVSELSVDSSGKEMHRVLGPGGVADLIKEMKRFEEEEWVNVGEDEELRSNLTSLTSSLNALLPKLHYTYKNSSLNQAITTLEATISTHQSNLDSLAKQHADELDSLSKQALVKLNAEEDRWRQQRRQERTKWEEEKRKFDVERKGFEQSMERLRMEKKELASQVEGLEKSAQIREGSLNSQRKEITKLRVKVNDQKATIMELQNENSSLVSEVASKPKRARTDDVDEEGNFLSDEDVEAGDESLEVADLSWESEHAPVRSTTSYRPSSSSSKKVLQTSNVNPSTVPFEPSLISNKRKAPSSGFSSGPRTKMAPPSFQTITSSSLFKLGSSGTIALGPKSSRR